MWDSKIANSFDAFLNLFNKILLKGTRVYTKCTFLYTYNKPSTSFPKVFNSNGVLCGLLRYLIFAKIYFIILIRCFKVFAVLHYIAILHFIAKINRLFYLPWYKYYFYCQKCTNIISFLILYCNMAIYCFLYMTNTLKHLKKSKFLFLIKDNF